MVRIRKQEKAGWVQPSDERQCHGKNQFYNRCGRWALKGRKFCARHGGKAKLFRRFNFNMYYSKHAGNALRKELEQVEKAFADKRTDLAQEIDVARVLAANSLKLLDAFLFDEEKKQQLRAKMDDETAFFALQDKAKKQVIEVLEFVGKLVGDYAKIQAMSTITMEHVDYIITQICKIIDDNIATANKPLADTVIELIKNVRLPKESRPTISIGM